MNEWMNTWSKLDLKCVFKRQKYRVIEIFETDHDFMHYHVSLRDTSAGGSFKERPVRASPSAFLRC
jgi:hypothetical protein